VAQQFLGGLAFFESVQDLVEFALIHVGVPPPLRIHHDYGALLALLQTARTGDHRIQPSVRDLLLQHLEKVHGVFPVAHALRVTADAKAIAHEDVKLGFLQSQTPLLVVKLPRSEGKQLLPVSADLTNIP
jgi:hypothetical protein